WSGREAVDGPLDGRGLGVPDRRWRSADDHRRRRAAGDDASQLAIPVAARRPVGIEDAGAGPGPEVEPGALREQPLLALALLFVVGDPERGPVANALSALPGSRVQIAGDPSRPGPDYGRSRPGVSVFPPPAVGQRQSSG